MTQREQQPQQNEQASNVRFERSAWIAVQREVEPQPVSAEAPLRLTDEHVIDARLDGDSIVRA
jgi:hypothetical protein